MYRTILFDLDGTLTDSGEGITKCVQYALRSFGIEKDPSELYSFVGPPLLENFMQTCGFTRAQAEQAAEKFRERYAPIGIYENRVYDGIRPLLQTLHQEGRRLCLATSKATFFATQIMDKFELTPYFDLIVGSEMGHERVHKNEVIDEVLRRLDVSPEEKKQTVMIGDRRYDIEGAVTCGLDSIGVYYGYANPGELEAAGATWIVRTVDELADLLERAEEAK
jgi:phosphoglycolate phosphatase